MNLKLLILVIVLPILAANAHLSGVLSKGQQFFSSVGRSAKDSFNSIREQGVLRALKNKVIDKVEQVLEEICENRNNLS